MVLTVVEFIGLLNVAVIGGALLGQRRVPFGVTESTVGVAAGDAGPPPASGSPHPLITTTNRSAGMKIFLKFELRISFSSSHTCKAIHVEPRRPEYTDLQICRLCKIEHPPQEAIEIWECSLLNSSRRTLLVKVQRAVEQARKGGIST